MQQTKEQLQESIVEKLMDFEWRVRNLYFIATEEGETIKFKPNTIQLAILKDIKNGMSERLIILKYRQGGVSTLYIIIMLDDVLFGGSNVNNIFITHRQDLLVEFFRKAKFIYDSIPVEIKAFLPEASVDNANELAFAKTRSGKMLNNCLKISLDVRGRTPTRLHVSEFAFMDNEKQKALKHQIDQFRKTKITIETTANGIGNTFYRSCMSAKNNHGTYRLLFFPWYIEERNKAEPPKDFVTSEDEKKLQKLYNLDKSQIYWRRLKIEDANALGLNGIEQFHQENPITIESAFVSSGSTVFDLTASYNIVRPQKEYEGWKIFQSPQDGLVFGIDIAEGGNLGDFSTMVAYNRHGELVLTYKARCNEEMLAKKLDEILKYEHLGKKYLGWILPENNLGRLFIAECKKFGWKHLLHPEIKTDQPIEENYKEEKKYGFRTTMNSKDYIIRLFRGAIHQQIIEVSEEIKGEIDTYIFDKNNRPNAISPNHDDLLMASMISYFGVKKIFGLLEYDKKNIKNNGDKAEDIRDREIQKMNAFGFDGVNRVNPEDEKEDFMDSHYEYENIN